MVVAVRLTIIFPTLKNNMNLTTGISIMRGVEVEVNHLHYSLPHDRRHIPNPVMNVSNKSNNTPNNSVAQSTLLLLLLEKISEV